MAIELFQAFQTEKNIYLVMEFVGGGSLFNVRAGPLTRDAPSSEASLPPPSS